MSSNGEILGYSLYVGWAFVLESDFHVVCVLPRGLNEASSALHGAVCSTLVVKLLPHYSCTPEPYEFYKKKVNWNHRGSVNCLLVKISGSIRDIFLFLILHWKKILSLLFQNYLLFSKRLKIKILLNWERC